MSDTYALPNEPLSIGGVVDAGARFFRATFKQTLPIAAVAALPYAVVSAAISIQSGGVESQVGTDAMSSAIFGVLILVPVMYVAIGFLVGCIGHYQGSLAHGRVATLGESVGVGVRRMVPLTLLMLLFFIAIMIGLVLLIIPGIIVMVSMSLFMYTSFMEEGASVWSGLQRSHSLVWGGNWWRTAAVITIISIIGMVLSVVFYIFIGGLAFASPTSEVGIASAGFEAIITWVMMTLYMPFSLAMFFALYNDLLLRKEGGDIEARLSELQ